jgi:hypothetical protein
LLLDQRKVGDRLLRLLRLRQLLLRLGLLPVDTVGAGTALGGAGCTQRRGLFRQRAASAQ